MNKNLVVIFPGFGNTVVRYENFKYLYDSFEDCEIINYDYLRLYRENKEKIINENIYIMVEEIIMITSKYTYENIILIGISFGSWLAILVAKELKNCHCLFIGAAISLNIGMKKSKGIAYQYVFGLDNCLEINDIRVSRIFLESLIQHQPLLYFDQIKSIRSALVLFGKNDNLFRKVDSLTLFNLFLDNSIECNFLEYENGRHMLNNKDVEKEVLYDIKKWRNDNEI